MKICYFGNPQSIHLQRWMRHFIDKGHEVHVMTLEPCEIEGAHIHDISASTPSIFYRLPIICRIFDFWHERYETKIRRILLEEIKPDILDAHYLTSYGIPASRLRFHPFIITIWGSDVLLAPKRFGKKHVALMKKALRKVDVILCSGENTKKETIKLVREPEKVKLISFGVDTQKFYPKPKDEKLWSSLGILDSQTVISIRNFELVYDIETLIKTIPLVLSQAPDTIFVIAGDGSLRDYLEELAKSLGIWENVRFVGWIPHDELCEYLASADIYVSTSLSDSGPSVSLLEAMSCGLPAVVTNVGDVKKWVRNGENGFVVPTGNLNVLALSIVRLLHNKDERDRLGQANRQMVEVKVNWQKTMGEVEDIYEGLIRGC
ncbi:glycosyltransferase [Chloroflexota bacterium]